MVTMARLGGLRDTRWPLDPPLYNPGLVQSLGQGWMLGGWMGSRVPRLMTKAQGSAGVRWVLGRMDTGLWGLGRAQWAEQGPLLPGEVCPQRVSGALVAVPREAWSLPAHQSVVWTEPGMDIGRPGPKAGSVMTPCDHGRA